MVILIKNNGVSEVIPVSEVTPAKNRAIWKADWRHEPRVGIWKVEYNVDERNPVNYIFGNYLRYV